MSALTDRLPPRREVEIVGTAERRKEIMKILCRRKHETIGNLAFELGVSERTIRRDIETLSLTEPIYTQTGRYCGGVYVVDSYSINQMYLLEKEAEILHKLFHALVNQKKCLLTPKELDVFHSIVNKYTKPINEKGKKDEKRRERII